MEDAVIIRRARETDLPELIGIFAGDDVGGHGDTTDESAFEDYLRAFHVIDTSHHEQLSSPKGRARSSARSRSFSIAR